MAVRDDFAAGEVLAAADLNDTFASKLPYSYGTATPSTTDSGFLWYDSNSTPAAPKFWDGSAFTEFPSGLVLVASETFSAVSSVSINGCFSASYENYVYAGQLSCSSQTQVSLRMRVSGSDNSTAGNYLWGGVYVQWVTSTTPLGEHSSTTATSFPLTDADGNPSFFEGKFFSPQASRLTGYMNTQAYNQGGSLNDGYMETFAGSMTVTTSYTGFTVFAAAGNMTGNIRVYGLKD